MFAQRDNSKRKTLAYFQNLYLVAAADGQLSQEETDFLVQVAAAMGITPRETSEIMCNIRNLDFVVPEEEEERLTQLEDIALMMMADKRIDDREYNLCLRFAGKIGQAKNALDKIIAKIALSS